RAKKIAHHFGDRDDVSRIDLGFIFLRPARPHRALDARAALQGFQRALDQRGLRQLAHADIGYLRGRHPQRHLVLHEIDHEQLELRAGDLLLLDRQNLADAMGGIDNEFVGLEALTLGQHLLRFLDTRRNSHRLRGRLHRDRLDRNLIDGSLADWSLADRSLIDWSLIDWSLIDWSLIDWSLGDGLRSSPGSSNLRSSGLRTGRFRGSFCSLVWHCASF